MRLLEGRKNMDLTQCRSIRRRVSNDSISTGLRSTHLVIMPSALKNLGRLIPIQLSWFVISAFSFTISNSFKKGETNHKSVKGEFKCTNKRDIDPQLTKHEQRMRNILINTATRIRSGQYFIDPRLGYWVPKRVIEQINLTRFVHDRLPQPNVCFIFFNFI